MGGRLQRPRLRPPPPLLGAVLGRRWRRRQADAPLRQPHQRLLPGQLALEPLLLAAQLLHFALGVVSRSARLRGAGSHQTTQGPRLHLVVTRHRGREVTVYGCAEQAASCGKTAFVKPRAFAPLTSVNPLLELARVPSRRVDHPTSTAMMNTTLTT